jgi:hypothetical protein
MKPHRPDVNSKESGSVALLNVPVGRSKPSQPMAAETGWLSGGSRGFIEILWVKAITPI